MDGVQADDLIAVWRRILIEGKAEQITSMLEDLETRLKSKGFERDAEAEKNMNWHPYQRNRVLCFVGGPEGGPRLRHAPPPRSQQPCAAQDDGSPFAEYSEAGGN